LLHRSLVEEAATTTSMATNMDLPAVEDSVRLLASSWVEATTTTSSILATTTMDLQEALVDLQAWPAHSWEVAALPTTTSLADSTDRTRTRATVEAAALTVAATSSNMDLTKATVAAVAEASSAAWWVETSTTVALADTVTRQEEAPAAPTLALRHQAHTSLRDSRTTANLVKDTAALTVDLRHPTHTSPKDSQTTASLAKDTAPTVAQHLRALHRSLVLTTHLETSRTDNNLTVDHNKADLEDTSSPAPTVGPLSSMVVLTKVATLVLEVTISNRGAMASPKVDTVDTRLLLEATEAEDMNSMATAVTEDDLCRAFFLGYRNVTCFSLRWRKFDDCTWKQSLRAWLSTFPSMEFHFDSQAKWSLRLHTWTFATLGL
jgi:hypothetical protein